MGLFERGFFCLQWLSSCCSSIKTRFVEHITSSYAVERFSSLSCESLQLLQSYESSIVLFYAVLAWPVSLGLQGSWCLSPAAIGREAGYTLDRPQKKKQPCTHTYTKGQL
ncbi:hypothetical protein ILYODFUR_011015 [Ilyodon furcidens]|uniref:Secreted protein n=1 Tax=Ilyodon furcidens TaxID=33524 RepID=A0ABV0SVZ1_9TELE